MRQFAHYTLLERVGVGGMGEVWMAQRPLITGSKVVALKIMSPQIYADEKYRTLFLEEVRIATSLGNNCIVQAHHAGVHEGICYLEMEWVDGVDLARLDRWLWQSGQKLPLHVGIYIIGEILRGLEFAHEQEVVHRDISPQNIMLSVAGEVKITDFGVAKVMTEETTSGDFKGKLIYAGPERIINPTEFGSDPRIDVFAVGAIFEEMVTGRRFRENINTFEGLIAAIRSMTPPSPLPARVLPPALDEFRRRLLSPDPERRAMNARSALAMLRTWPGFRDARSDLQQFVRTYQSQSKDAGAVGSNNFILISKSASKSSSDEVPMTAVGSARGEAQPRMQLHQWIAVVLAALGTCIGSCGVGAALVLARSAELGSATVVERELPSETTKLPTNAEPKLESEPKPEPVRTPERLLASPVGDEELVAQGDEAPVEPAKACGRSEVTFVSGQYPYAWIKVGGREYLLEPHAKVMLACNKRHSVRMRLSEDGEWGKLGYVDVEANKRYRVTLQKTAPRLRIEIDDSRG